MRFLLLLPLLLVGLMATAQNEQSEKKEPPTTMKVGNYEVYVMPDRRPHFPGGNKAMMEYMQKKLKYPESAVADSVEGQVIVRFIVDEKGHIQDAAVMRPLHDELDKAALEFVQGMPKWEPGMKGDKAVAVQHMVPVRFVLPKE